MKACTWKELSTKGSGRTTSFEIMDKSTDSPKFKLLFVLLDLIKALKSSKEYSSPNSEDMEMEVIL